MTADVLISGALFRAPEQKTSKTGRPYVSATLRVVNGNEAHFWRIFVFSESAQAEMMRLGEGDAIACQGTPKFELYMPVGAAPRISLSMTADHVLALRQAPKERKKKDGHAPPPRPEKPAGSKL